MMIQLYYNPTIFQTESINNGPPCPLCKGVNSQEEIKKTYCKVKWSSCGVSYRGYFSILFDKKKLGPALGNCSWHILSSRY